jgi:hypothetical protein
VKIFATKAEINLVEAIPVFHKWIQNKTMPELLIDVADYKHVPEGPGVMLIGHDADYSLDETDGRLGLLYNRKVEVEGDALQQAFTSAHAAVRVLESTEAFAGRLQFSTTELEVILNDRLLFPNTDETWAAVSPALEAFATHLYGEGNYTIERRGEPRDRVRAGITKN